MDDPAKLIKGEFYFSVSYPDPSLKRPIIASYEYVGDEMIENDEGNIENHYLFKFHPVYKSEDEDAIENGFIAYSKNQLKGLSKLEELLLELESIKERL